MSKHKKLYLNYFGYREGDFIGCSVCSKTAVDIHHIDCRGMGGSKTKDTIENLIAVCRECHILYGDKTKYKDFLFNLQKQKIDEYNNR